MFAAIGRRSHAEGASAAGVLDTAWPFLAGAAAGWLARAARGHDLATLASGSTIWGSTVVGGMVLRRVSGDGTAASFILVATLVLGVLLLGWRFAAGARPSPSGQAGRGD